MEDLVIIVLLIFGAWRGWMDGLVRELAKLVGFLLGVLVAWRFYDQLGGSWIMFLLICVGVPVLLGFAARVMTRALDFTIVGGLMNRVLGALVGAGKWALLIGFILLIADKVEEWKTLLEIL